MKISRNEIYALLALAVIVLAVAGAEYKDKILRSALLPTPTPVSDGANTASASAQDLIAHPRPPADDFAKCSIGGEIDFKSKDLAVMKDARLVYSDIDSISRHIIWSITPDSGEDIDIGPNLFAGLELPDGEESIVVVFNDTPKHKHYTLKAEVTYGVIIGGDLYTRQTDCDGSASINILF